MNELVAEILEALVQFADAEGSAIIEKAEDKDE